MHTAFAAGKRFEQGFNDLLLAITEKVVTCTNEELPEVMHTNFCQPFTALRQSPKFHADLNKAFAIDENTRMGMISQRVLTRMTNLLDLAAIKTPQLILTGRGDMM